MLNLCNIVCNTASFLLNPRFCATIEALGGRGESLADDSKAEDGSYELLNPDQLREAVQRLGQAEDALESLTEQYHSMEAKLESQRNQGRGTRSAVFNRMLAEKLMLSGMLERFRFYELKL